MPMSAKATLKQVVFAAALAVASVAAEAAYVRGELVWRFDFTPEEMAKQGLATRRFDADGTGCAYLPDGGPGGKGAMAFKTVGLDKNAKAKFGESCHFRLTFEPLPAGTTAFDFKEGDKKGDFFFLGMKVKE